VNRATAVAGRFFDDIVSVEPFGRGHINETFLVVTRAGDFVLQRVNRRVFADVEGMSANIETVQRHVPHGLVPELAPARSGDFLVRDAGEPDGSSDVWRSWRRVPEDGPADAITAGAATRAARLLGRFHTAVADLDPARLVVTLPDFHALERRLGALRASVDEDPCDRRRTVATEIEIAYANEALVGRSADITARVPVRVTHNDAKIDNVLFRDGEAVCLVDLDTVMPGAWFWDIGDLLRTASTTAAEDDPSATVDGDLYRAIVDAYGVAVASVATSAEIEAIDHAGAIVVYEQAVRFLTDWIAGDVYYRTSRPEQNLDRARAQFHLLASMPGTVTPP
jgi:Ser/Thr protein kinase RdoA (MazF antagonist)